MGKKFLTIEDLYQFCKANNFSHFNSKEFNGPIILQSFEEVESNGDSHNGLCPVQLKACHIGLNANRSTISEQSMKDALDSFRGRPILGSIIKLDSGEYDFHSHDIKIVVNEDGATEEEHIEIPVGVTNQIHAPTLQYDKIEDKTYVMINGNIFEDYSKAADIMRRRRTAKCSVEIAVEELSYDAEQDALSIDKFHFTGVTILGHEPDGTEIQEGMKGSKITIDSFSADNNSMLGINYQDKMIEVLEKLNTTLSNFNDNYSKKGGNVNMGNENIINVVTDEVVEESIQLDGETMITESIMEETADVVTEDAPTEETVDEPVVVDETPTEEDPVVEEFSDSEPAPLVCTFRISHDDTRYGLQSLLNAMCDESHFYSVLAVYDKYFYYCDYFSGDSFKQAYKVRKDVVSFSGDPEPVFTEFVTQSERDALEKLRKDYAELVQFKADTEAAQLQAQKDAIFADNKYVHIKETKLFRRLIESSKNYSIEECLAKANEIWDDLSSFAVTFATNSNDKKQKSIGIVYSDESDVNERPYGGLFDD